MEKELKYKVIKTKEQYYDYCSRLEELIIGGTASGQDEIDLLELLIDTWDNAHDPFDSYDPVQLLEALMTENGMKQIDLAREIGIGESYLSEILSYKKALSKKMIQKLSDAFGIRKEAFSKPYELKRVSGMSKLAAGVSYLIQGQESNEPSLLFGEPDIEYKQPETAQQTRRSKKDQ
jgi:HTH-type transcriptional regulator / antitoxin HigA